MSNKPVVSIIIPCYNAAQFVGKTITSVLQQTYTSIELIVINDGSTDDSLQVINSFAHLGARIIDKPNSGVSATRNMGLDLSTGTYIHFLDSDDLIPSDYIEKAVLELEKNPSADFCTFQIEYIDEKDKLIENKIESRGVYDNIQREIVSFSPNVSACPSAYIYRKEKLTFNYIRFDEALQSPEDRHFLLQVGKVLSGVLITSSKLKYRIRHNSLSHTKTKALHVMQETYYQHVTNDQLIIDDDCKKIFRKKMSRQLFVTYFRQLNFKKVVYYLLHYFNFM